MTSSDHQQRSLAITVASIILFIALWYIGSHLIGEQLLPSPQRVLERLLEEILAESLFYHTGVTLIRVLVSFTLAMSIESMIELTFA